MLKTGQDGLSVIKSGVWGP